MGNSCNSKNRFKNFLFFSDLFENSVEFLHSVCAVYGDQGLYRIASEKLGDFLETFLPEGTKFLYRGLLKVH